MPGAFCPAKKTWEPRVLAHDLGFCLNFAVNTLCSRVVVPGVILVVGLWGALIHGYYFKRPWSLLSPARLLLARWHCWLQDTNAAQRASSAAIGYCRSQTSPREGFGGLLMENLLPATPDSLLLWPGRGTGMPPAPRSAPVPARPSAPHRAAPGARQRAGAGADDQAGHGEKRPVLLQLVRVFLRHRGQRDPGGLYRLVSTWRSVITRHPGPQKAPC